MDIIFTTKTMNEIIGYWIESNYMYCQLSELTEYSDEVGEIYDHQAWLGDNQTGRGTSVMDIHIYIEEAADKAMEVYTDAESKLNTILVAGIETKDPLFADYSEKITEVEKTVRDICEYLNENFYEIYDYSQEIQMENFYKVLDKALRTVVNGEELTEE